MKKRFKIILGICLIPLFVLAYYNDKLIMFLLPNLEQPSIQNWFRNNKAMSSTLIRLIVFWASIGIYHFLSWLIG
jgi:hypothetical protein